MVGSLGIARRGKIRPNLHSTVSFQCRAQSSPEEPLRCPQKRALPGTDDSKSAGNQSLIASDSHQLRGLAPMQPSQPLDQV